MAEIVESGIRMFAFLLLLLIPAYLTSGQTTQERLLSNHRIYSPEGQEPRPGVVAIPGCSGVSLGGRATDAGGGSPTDSLFRRHYPRMAERLMERGYVVMLVDYLSGEGVINACRGEVSPSTIASYVHAAVGFLRRHERVDSTRVHVIGWSLGGAGLLAALERMPAEASSSFRSAVAFYPGCAAPRPWSTEVPVLMLLGGLDDITPPDVCEQLVESVLHRESVELHRYSEARHGFDVEGAPAVISTGRGTTIGYNDGAALAAWAEVFRFLEAHE